MNYDNKFGSRFLGVVTVLESAFRSQKEKAVTAANEHLQGVAEWAEPKGGMFLWIKVPGIADTKSMIEEKALVKEGRRSGHHTNPWKDFWRL